MIAYAIAGRWDRTLELSEQLMEGATGFAKGVALGGRCAALIGNGRFREALEVGEEGVRELVESGGHGTVSSGFTLQMIWLLNTMGESETAIARARRSLEDLPSHHATAGVLVDLLAAAGRYDEAQAELDDLDRRVSATDSSWGRYHVDLAAAHLSFRRGDYEEALSRLERARRHPRILRTPMEELALEGGTQLARGDAAAAVEAYRQCLDPRVRAGGPGMWSLIEPLYDVGVAEQEAADYPAAREHLTQFLDRWGNADVPIPAVADARKRLEALQRVN